RKESLGRGQTGGGTALPIFNAFMNPFMKDKARDTFPGVPPIPSEIRALMERNKREEAEKLARAELAAAKSGASTEPVTTNTETDAQTGTGSAETTLRPGTETRPAVPEPPPPVVRPLPQPETRRTPETRQPSQPEGTQRKGKKGDG
ncbi:MAG TPA: hypothetical protein PKE66_07055, partial [Pyrinomonadaceae bacterium]|nr:hypothetical protein [Pyrinomonadaceae bacterium]